MSTGLIHLYVGSGKGKTTASVGLAVRAAGYDKRIMFVQFLKGSKTGELVSLEKLGIHVLRTNKNMGFSWSMNKEEQEEYGKIQEKFLEEIIGTVLQRSKEPAEAVDLLVLDEVLDVVSYSKHAENVFKDFVSKKPESLELVLTGRKAPDWLMEKADYITEMRKIKHPYDQGTKARQSVEY